MLTTVAADNIFSMGAVGFAIALGIILLIWVDIGGVLSWIVVAAGASLLLVWRALAGLVRRRP